MPQLISLKTQLCGVCMQEFPAVALHKIGPRDICDTCLDLINKHSESHPNPPPHISAFLKAESAEAVASIKKYAAKRYILRMLFNLARLSLLSSISLFHSSGEWYAMVDGVLIADFATWLLNKLAISSFREIPIVESLIFFTTVVGFIINIEGLELFEFIIVFILTSILKVSYYGVIQQTKNAFPLR